MKTIFSDAKTLALACLAVSALFFASLVPASAVLACTSDEQEISLPVDQGGTKCIPINERSKNLEDNPIFFYLRSILIFLAGGVGIAVVGGIVVGSYMYITARANAAQTQKGQDTITNSVVGLLLFIFMYAILQFVIPGGIFR